MSVERLSSMLVMTLLLELVLLVLLLVLLVSVRLLCSPIVARRRNPWCSQGLHRSDRAVSGVSCSLGVEWRGLLPAPIVRSGRVLVVWVIVRVSGLGVDGHQLVLENLVLCSDALHLALLTVVLFS